MREKYILTIRILGTLIAAELVLGASLFANRSEPSWQVIPTVSINYEGDPESLFSSDMSGAYPIEEQATDDPSFFIEDDLWERETGEALAFLNEQGVVDVVEPADGYPPPQDEYSEIIDEDYLEPPGLPWDEWGGTGGQGGYPPPDANNPDPVVPTNTIAPDPVVTETPVPQPTDLPSPTPKVNPTGTPVPPSPTPAPIQTGNVLTSLKVDASPALDGIETDEAWQNAQAVVIQTQGGVNSSATTVTIQSVYDEERVYFLLSWVDPNQSFLYMPWEKQADTTWKRLVSPENKGGDENNYAEDKIALMWPITDNLADFTTQGCGIACHTGENPETKPYGNKYLPNQDQIADLWVWKSVRNLGQVDDLYLDSTRYSDENLSAGRSSDPREGGGYTNNETDDHQLPEYTAPDGGERDGSPGFVLNDERQQFEDDLFQAGDRLPSIRKSAFEGDRGDITAAWQYRDGHWWLEISRKLNTDSDHDVQFDDLEQVFSFALATFDNTQVRHATQSGTIELRFED